MKFKICNNCLTPADKLWFHKGTLVCPNCYHKLNSKRKFINQNKLEKNPTFEDLKNKLEKNY